MFRKFLAILGITLQVLFVNCTAQEIVPAPSTATGNLLEAYLVAHNAGDEHSFQIFKEQHYPKLEVDRHLGFREMTGGLDLVRINSDGKSQINAVLKAREDDLFFQINIVLKEESDSEATDLKISGMDPPAELLPKRMEMKDVLVEVDKKADAYFAAGEFSGTFMVVHHDQVVHAKSWGLADRKKQIPIDSNTKFRIASMGKMFTAVAVLQLVDEGKLALDQNVGHYLTSYPNKALADKVTIRELLNHTGGTGDIFTPEYLSKKEKIRTVSDYLKLFGKRDPEFSPGSQDGYSNYGFVLLGALIEKVTGYSYYDYVKKHVLDVAGMKDTGAQPETEIVKRVAVGYIQDDNGKLTTNSTTLPYRASPAGGAYSTVGDLVKFIQALEQGRLISKATLIEATKPQNTQHWYGYGFMVGADGPQHWFGHEGGAPGMNGMLKVYPDSGYIVLCLSNADSTSADRLVNFFTYRMPI